jgi:hypothetical protein
VPGDLHPDLPALVKYPAVGPYLHVYREDLFGLQLLCPAVVLKYGRALPPLL